MMGQKQKEETTEQVSEMQSSASERKGTEEAAAPVELSQRLFEYAMKDQWDKVLEAYNKEKPESHTAWITEAKDTALHLAVSGGKLEFVYKMVGIIGENALKAKNKRGDTPLHIAAALGNTRMCYCMASKHPNLIAERNKNKETPFYLAAQFGHKDAFLCLCFFRKGDQSDILSRNEGGNNILHAAIDGEYFDLAFQIIRNYPKQLQQLLDDVNTTGYTPLHILATKTNAFNSGSRLGLFDRILYRCIIVDELMVTKSDSEDYWKRFEEKDNRGGRVWFPQNYETRRPSHINHKNKKSITISDEENPQGSSEITQGESSSSQTKSESNNSIDAVKVSSDTGTSLEVKEDREDESRPAEKDGQHYLPAIYATFIQFLKFVMKILLAVFRPGFQWIKQITTKKQKHTQGTSKRNQGESSSSQIKPESKNSVGAVEVSSGTGTSPKAKKDKGDESPTAEEHKHYLPANYATFIQIFKFVIKFLLVVSGLGFRRIQKITAKKQRHKWASQVMNELIDKSSQYKYSGGKTGSREGKKEENFPHLSMMMSSSNQDTDTGNKENSLVENKTVSSEKEGNDAMVEKFLREYHITGSVDSKTSEHRVQMKFEQKIASESTKLETPSPILIAASKGTTEMVEKILEKYPVAIQDVDAEDKNVLLLAVEHRQTHTFQFLKEKEMLHESVFRHRDKHGNNALHLAARHGHYRPWLIPGSALQMQWELKWYKFVKKSMAKYLLVHSNNKGKTPKQIFTETHKELVKEGSEWLTKTSESCSVIAALIATVAFATAASIPGGADQQTGKPVLRDEPAFGAFALSSLVALCFSITALVFFLAILTSRFEEKDFAKKLPQKLIVGLTSLFTSIAAMLVSFCAGHFFELKDKLKFAALPIYTATCLPISFFALAQLPLYFDLLRAIFKRVPQRSYKEFAS